MKHDTPNGGVPPAISDEPGTAPCGARPLGLDPIGRDAPISHAEAWAVVLAGGEGTRLRGFVRQVFGSERPKQFCRIIGSRSMLRHPWDRAARVVDPDRIVTVITAEQERYLEEEARHSLPGSVLVQSVNKETAPAPLLPLLWIARRSPEARVVVFPSDHFVWDEEALSNAVRIGLLAARRWPDRLTLLGVHAQGPEIGYDWVAPGGPIAPGVMPGLYWVRHC